MPPTSAEDSPFPHFAEPRRFSTYESRPQPCDLCHQVGPGYADAFLSDADGAEIRFVCEPDLIAGRLADVRARANTADRFALEEQAATLHGDWTAQQLDSYCDERIRRVEVCTPSVPTWQEMEWPAHCAEFMRYLREIGRPDCEQLGGSSGGHAFLAKAIALRDGEMIDERREPAELLWAAMRADSPRSSSNPTDTSFYLFQCLVCRGYAVLWDSDEIEAIDTADDADEP